MTSSSRMRFLALILVVCCVQQQQQALAHPDAEGAAGGHPSKPEEDGADRELKTNEEGYDFFSIDQLFMNNPQYAKLLSDLQAHSFGSNWRRKRDVEDAGDVQQEPQQPNREDEIDEQPSAPEVTAESREETATTAAIAEITEVMRDTKEQTQETQEAEGRTTPVKTASPSSTTAAVSSAAPSSTTASASFGFSGSTEATHGRPEEPTTSASPIRSSTPRRLLHKGGNKNKNKQGGNKNNPNKQDSVTAQNVNKFTVTNTPTFTVPASSSSSSSSSTSSSASTPSQVTASISPNSQATSSSSASSNMADAAAAVAASTASNVTAGGNKDKVGLAPTKYHYYPHNQHIYFLPECAIQQVCNAVYVRLNYTQPLCACPPRYRDPCSASLNEDDNHTIKLVGNAQRKAITLAKTCENTNELRECRAPKDWSILALQNSRTGKSHYLVICKCPPHYRLEGPLAHDQPTYAGLPGINVYGMLCVPPESYAPKPAKTPAQHPQQHIYNKWKVRPSTVSSYRSFQNVTAATADYE